MNLKLVFIERFLMPLLLSFLMTGIISLVSTLNAMGLNNFSVIAWLNAWLWSWLVAFPTLLVILPVVKKYVQSLIEKEQIKTNLTDL